MVPLEKLGNRIAIIGCSNSGKSTLANALSKKLGISAWHLDHYAHFPHTDWKRQSDAVLIKEHEVILQQKSWIIDGNYSVCMSPRLDLATGVIWLDFPVFSAVARYIFRSIRNDPQRPGRLAGAKKGFNLALVKWILFNYPKNRLKYEGLLKNRPYLIIVHLNSMSLLKKYYKHWEI